MRLIQSSMCACVPTHIFYMIMIMSHCTCTCHHNDYTNLNVFTKSRYALMLLSFWLWFHVRMNRLVSGNMIHHRHHDIVYYFNFELPVVYYYIGDITILSHFFSYYRKIFKVNYSLFIYLSWSHFFLFLPVILFYKSKSNF